MKLRSRTALRSCLVAIGFASAAGLVPAAGTQADTLADILVNPEVDARPLQGTVADATRDAYSQPFSTLRASDRDTFIHGRSVFQRAWVVAPSLDTNFDGLGPLHSRLACHSCHQRNGRGLAPEQGQRLQTMLVRLAVPGQKENGDLLPHSIYGDQLNEDAVPGVRAEGRVSLLWHESTVTLEDGKEISLRRPEPVFSRLAHGDLNDTMTSPRVGPVVYGLGLLEQVPASALEALEQQAASEGGRGFLNRVHDPVTGTTAIGRFNYKASAASVLFQSAKAMQGDLGITSRYFPQQNCSPQQANCQQATNGGDPEITDEQLHAVAFYLENLAVPQRRDTDQPQVVRGEEIFRNLACNSCHREQLPMPSDYLHANHISPYTDLMVHDMGEGLADGITEFKAGPQHWRTTPLWGLGLSALISESEQYLHDGRARSLPEAILWHGGEAQSSRDSYAALPAADREALTAFLHSL